MKKVAKEINEKYSDQKSTIYLSTADMVETSVQTMVKEVLLGALFATIVIMVFFTECTIYIHYNRIHTAISWLYVIFAVIVGSDAEYFDAGRCRCSDRALGG
ncbi:hypothetical protein RCO48_23475 [Peribacillus frigoritolerans]|nr:hypothetical protein [Peribacillus frigoritolerans]